MLIITIGLVRFIVTYTLLLTAVVVLPSWMDALNCWYQGCHYPPVSLQSPHVSLMEATGVNVHITKRKPVLWWPQIAYQPIKRQQYFVVLCKFQMQSYFPYLLHLLLASSSFLSDAQNDTVYDNENTLLNCYFNALRTCSVVDYSWRME